MIGAVAAPARKDRRREYLGPADAVHQRLMREELVLLDDARRLFPNHPSKGAMWRWATGRGLNGCWLESTLIGRNRYTSKPAIARFLAAVNAADEARRAASAGAEATKPAGSERRVANAERDSEIDLARKRLAAAGLL